MGISIDSLINKPFITRSYKEQLEIFLEGKPPRPSFFDCDVEVRFEKKRECKRLFYGDSVEWLTGCEKRKKLFCWPCVLFVSERIVWNYEGFGGNDEYVYPSIRIHEKSNLHIQAVLDLHMFSKNLKVPVVRNCLCEGDITKHNNLVTRNREILKTMVGAICYMVSKEQCPSHKMDRHRQPLVENCLDLLKLMQGRDLPVLTHEDNAIALLRKSPSLFSDLICAITDVMANAIRDEIRGVPHVSIILNETSDISTKSQISTMLRYVKDAKIYERFLGFTKIVEYKSSDVLFKHISKVVNEYELSEKLVSQSYDGSVTSIDHLYCLVEKVRKAYRLALLVPCYFHDFETTLLKGLSHIRECDKFFKTLDGFGAYFSEDSKRRQAFEGFMVGKIPRLRNTGCYLKPLVTGCVKKHRKQLIDFFQCLIENPKMWDTEDIVKARGYLEFLVEFPTVFLLEIFSKIFGYSETLTSALKCEMPEGRIPEELDKARLRMINFRESGFDYLWATTVLKISEQSKCERLNLQLDEESKFHYRELFYNVMDCTRQQFDLRGQFIRNYELDFFRLLNPHCVENSDEFRRSLWLYEYKILFDFDQLQNELKVVYNHVAFADKSTQGILEFLVQDKMTSNFSQISRLAELILTLPCKQVRCASSTMESFKDWSYVLNDQDTVMSSWAFLCVEKKLLLELKCDKSFFDNVVDKFMERNNNLELMHK